MSWTAKDTPEECKGCRYKGYSEGSDNEFFFACKLDKCINEEEEESEDEN